ncbi:MAG: YdcF family protein [Rhodoferax sp.]|nr:YdcF family protein [Rhodoferax sp.]MDP3650595.1 YdcF family protein [Rhodoferax sp.]
MFILSKILGALAQPLAWVAALLFLGLILFSRRPRLARRLIGTALALMLLMGWQPLPDLLIRHLEQQYAEMPPQADLRSYVGVIVLGGATESGEVAQAHTQPLLNGAAERMTAPVAALLRTSHLRVVFTGGEGALLGSGPSEASRAQVFFDSMGLSGKRVEYESASRTTYENAVLTAQLPGVDKTQRWLLVTSAWHMPRSMATFVKAGWNVTAYPVDFRTGVSTRWTEYSLRDGVDSWQLALHELLGLAAYRATGRL